MITEGGLTVPEVARRLSIPSSTLRYWVKINQEGLPSNVGKQRKPLAEIEIELARLRRELAEVKMERDFLKKAAAYFAKEPKSGTRS